MAILFAPYKQLWIVHMLISFLGSTRFLLSSSKTITFVSAFAVQQRQRASLKPAHCKRNNRSGNCLPIVLSQCRDEFWSPSRSSARMMSDSSQNRPQRPELVLSVKDYLQYTAGSTNHTKPAHDDTGIVAAKIQLVLASASPRRREILDMMGLQNKYVVIPSPLNESQLQTELRKNDQIDPIFYTRTLAEQKAYAVAYDMLSQQSTVSSELSTGNNNIEFNHPMPRLILGSDTVVAIKDRNSNMTTVLEKPVDTNDAIRMLQQLQNKSHIVYTGVAIVRFTASPSQPKSSSTTTRPPVSHATTENGCFRDNGSIQLVQSFVETSTVHVSAMNDIDIQSYVDTTEPMDKAGAYGIQGIGGQIVTKIVGDFFTVMGLPMHQTSRALASAILDLVDEACSD